ncbi:hypothetical protein D3C73_1292560 [compost metagenome]
MIFLADQHVDSFLKKRMFAGVPKLEIPAFHFLAAIAVDAVNEERPDQPSPFFISAPPPGSRGSAHLLAGILLDQLRFVAKLQIRPEPVADQNVDQLVDIAEVIPRLRV